MLPTGYTVLPVGVPSQKTFFVACNTYYDFITRAMSQVAPVTSEKVKGWKENEVREQTDNYCNHYQKLKEINLIIKLFIQTIGII